jgi:hypothetical protein
MGHYWDQIDRKWIPRPRWEKRPTEKRRFNRRRELVRELIAEIQDSPVLPPDRFEADDAEYVAIMQQNDRASKLYAVLLAHTLIGTDEWLMRLFGQQIAELTAGDEKVAR